MEAKQTECSEENWVPLLEYAVRKGVSLSTLRRHIKSNKVRFKVEDGRYLLFESHTKSPPPEQNQLSLLETRLRKAQEEIAEMRMLIALYEEKISTLRPEL